MSNRLKPVGGAPKNGAPPFLLPAVHDAAEKLIIFVTPFVIKFLQHRMSRRFVIIPSAAQIVKCAMIAVMAMTVASCGTTRKTAAKGRPSQSVHVAQVKALPGPATAKNDGDAAQMLVAEARTWLGVPYKYGGNDRKGTDCSGLISCVFKNALGVDMPRTTGAQHGFCTRVHPDEIVPGDILFYASKQSSGKTAHVGLYVGGGRMIHASSSRGVVEDDISLAYYRTHFVGAGRTPFAGNDVAADANAGFEPAVSEQGAEAENSPRANEGDDPATIVRKAFGNRQAPENKPKDKR